MSKSASPYEIEKDYWDQLPKEARDWVEKYSKAVEFGNFNILRELCDTAPSEMFEEIKQEIIYERDFYKRNQYTIPTSRFSRYSEHDYSWAASMLEHHPKVDMRQKIDNQYNAQPTGKNMTWVK